jgi:hypothetical protein
VAADRVTPGGYSAGRADVEMAPVSSYGSIIARKTAADVLPAASALGLLTLLLIGP